MGRKEITFNFYDKEKIKEYCNIINDGDFLNDFMSKLLGSFPKSAFKNIDILDITQCIENIVLNNDNIMNLIYFVFCPVAKKGLFYSKNSTIKALHENTELRAKLNETEGKLLEIISILIQGVITDIYYKNRENQNNQNAKYLLGLMSKNLDKYVSLPNEIYKKYSDFYKKTVLSEDFFDLFASQKIEVPGVNIYIFFFLLRLCENLAKLRGSTGIQTNQNHKIMEYPEISINLYEEWLKKIFSGDLMISIIDSFVKHNHDRITKELIISISEYVSIILSNKKFESYCEKAYQITYLLDKFGLFEILLIREANISDINRYKIYTICKIVNEYSAFNNKTNFDLNSINENMKKFKKLPRYVKLIDDKKKKVNEVFDKLKDIASNVKIMINKYEKDKIHNLDDISNKVYTLALDIYYLLKSETADNDVVLVMNKLKKYLVQLLCLEVKINCVEYDKVFKVIAWHDGNYYTKREINKLSIYSDIDSFLIKKRIYEQDVDLDDILKIELVRAFNHINMTIKTALCEFIAGIGKKRDIRTEFITQYKPGTNLDFAAFQIRLNDFY